MATILIRTVGIWRPFWIAQWVYGNHFVCSPDEAGARAKKILLRRESFCGIAGAAILSDMNDASIMGRDGFSRLPVSVLRSPVWNKWENFIILAAANYLPTWYFWTKTCELICWYPGLSQCSHSHVTGTMHICYVSDEAGAHRKHFPFTTIKMAGRKRFAVLRKSGSHTHNKEKLSKDKRALFFTFKLCFQWTC